MVPKARKQVRLGPGGVLYVMAAALIIAVAVFTQNNLLFWGFGLMNGGLIVSLLAASLSLGRVTLERVPLSHGVAGEPLMLRYRVTNRRRWLPLFGLLIEERLSEAQDDTSPGRAVHGVLARAWIMHLGPGQHLQAEAPCWPARRGTLALESVVLSTAFPFGILKRTVTFHLPATVLVYPHLWRIRRRVAHRLLAAETGGQRRRDSAGGHEEFFGLRPYRPGDSLKTIDWRRSARTGDWVSREMTQPSPPRVMIVLNLHGSPPGVAKDQETPAESADDAANQWAAADPVEAAISLAASLVCAAHLHGCRVGLVVRGGSGVAFPVHHSLPHRTRLLEALALLNMTAVAAETPVPWIEPTVAISPTGGTAAGLPSARRCEHWAATELARYAVAAPDKHVESLLSRRAPVQVRRARRMALAEGSSWR